MLEPSDARLHTSLVISESAFLLVLISVSILPKFPAPSPSSNHADLCEKSL